MLCHLPAAACWAVAAGAAVDGYPAEVLIFAVDSRCRYCWQVAVVAAAARVFAAALVAGCSDSAAVAVLLFPVRAVAVVVRPAAVAVVAAGSAFYHFSPNSSG